jgi:hypothetical protein
MRRISNPLFALSLIVVVLAGVFVAGFARRTNTTIKAAPARMARVPSLVLWAWERPEQLNYLDSTKVGVAFLSKTIYLRHDRVLVRPRLQPLSVAEDVPLVAVTRIEADTHDSPTFSANQLSEASKEIAELSRLPRVTTVQIDFDAKLSEREFYRKLIIDLRKQLPENTALSITALASWCSGDNWLEDLPIDEAVPMLFRMGVDRNQILSQLTSETPFRSSKCRTSAGISVDEPLKGLPRTRRVYVFNPDSWSREAVQAQMRNQE